MTYKLAGNLPDALGGGVIQGVWRTDVTPKIYIPFDSANTDPSAQPPSAASMLIAFTCFYWVHFFATPGVRV